MRITRRQLRRLIVEATEGAQEQCSEHQQEAFMKYADETRAEIESILEMYGGFIDKAGDDEEGMKSYSADAARDFLRGRLEAIGDVSRLPWA